MNPYLCLETAPQGKSKPILTLVTKRLALNAELLPVYGKMAKTEGGHELADNTLTRPE